MSNFAAKCLVAHALAWHGAHAAITCATGWVPDVAGNDDAYCPSDVESCKTSNKCCVMQPTCASTTHSLVCAEGMYNAMNDAFLVSSVSDDETLKAECCMNKATCADATCIDGYEKNADNSAVKCPGGPATCAEIPGCCKVKAGSCFEWFSGGGRCSEGMSVMDYAKTGSDEASCCTTRVMCNTYTCPATHELIANADATLCWPLSTCTNSLCCKYKGTSCYAAKSKGAVVCGSNEYIDPSKDGVTFTAAADCCTAQAQCKDTANTQVSVSVTTTPTIFLIATFLYTAAN